MNYVKTAAVDLDMVVLKYDGWKGLNHFGEVIPGAVEFIRWLQQQGYTVLIFTTRGNWELNKNDADPHQSGRDELYLKWLIESALDSHGVPYDDIYVGQGKPLADIYIDDCAVSCRPQETGSYEEVKDFITQLAAKEAKKDVSHD